MLHVTKIEDLKGHFDINDLNIENWREISCESLSKEFIEDYADKLDWSYLVEYNNLSENLLRKYQDRIPNWQWERFIPERYTLSNNFMRDFEDKMFVDLLIENQIISGKLALRWLRKDMTSMHEIIEHQPISRKLIDPIMETDEKHYLDWYEISKKPLPKDFIEKYFVHLEWGVISSYQELSEDIIEQFENKVDWKKTSRYQKMSSEFVVKHYDKVDIDELMQNDKINKELEEKEIFTMLRLLKSS